MGPFTERMGHIDTEVLEPALLPSSFSWIVWGTGILRQLPALLFLCSKKKSWSVQEPEVEGGRVAEQLGCPDAVVLWTVHDTFAMV